MSDFQTTAMPSALPSAFAPLVQGRPGTGTAAVNGGAPAANAPRPSVIQLVFREKGALYAAYIPLFAEGGLFVPSTREYQLGDDIYLLLSLDRKSTRLNSSHSQQSRMPSSA